MSFFRKKAAVEIPPVDTDRQRRELLGNRTPPSRSSPYPSQDAYDARPSPPAYNRAPPSRENENRPSERRFGNGPPASRAIGDPYSRGGDADAARAQLFAGYKPANSQNGPGSRSRDANGSSAEDGQREFQTQQDEDEEVEGIKRDIRETKQESVNSTRNALRIAREAEETGRNTLLRLGDQSEKLANTERYMDQGKVRILTAEDRTDELKKLNRSIFRPAITLNKESKRLAQEEKVRSRYEEEKLNRERGMQDVRETQNRLGQTVGQLETYDGGEWPQEEEGISGRRTRQRTAEEQRTRQAQRSRFQFEKTASDDEMEDEIDDNLEALHSVAKNLKAISLAAGEEVDNQIRRIDVVSNKARKVDDRVKIVTHRLDNVK